MVLVAGDYRGGFCEKLLASSNTDLPLAKDEPISGGGRASGITDLRRGKRKLLGHRNCSQREE